MKLPKVKAGWVLCWGVYDWTQGLWLIATHTSACWSSTPRKRYAYAQLRDAKHSAFVGDAVGGIPRPFWRRTRPKPTTGEAIVRVTVEGTIQDTVLVRLKSGATVMLRPEDIEPAEAAR